jgi:hypothetical protein
VNLDLDVFDSKPQHGDVPDDGRVRKCLNCGSFLYRCACGGALGEDGSHFCAYDHVLSHDVEVISEQEAYNGRTISDEYDLRPGPPTDAFDDKWEADAAVKGVYDVM